MLLREQSLLRQWRNIEKAPAGAGAAAAVKKTAGGDSCGGVGLLAKGEGMGRCGWWKGEGGGIWVTGRGGAGRRKGSCWSEHCCGSGEIQIGLLREQTLQRQWGNTDRAPAGADTATAVGKYR